MAGGRDGGGIGFETQKDLLAVVAPWLPVAARIILMGDRFDGTADLITWCQEHGWSYRLRLLARGKTSWFTRGVRRIIS